MQGLISNFGEYYNYVYKKYNYDTLIQSSALSIDFITIHYKPSSLSYSTVCKHLRTLKKFAQEGADFHRCRPLVNGKRYNLEIQFTRTEEFFVGTICTLRHPDIDLIKYVESVLGVGYTLNKVEYTVDLLSEDPVLLFKIIRWTSVLSWPGKGFDSSYSTTQYMNDGRGSSGKGGKSYLKDISGQVVVRLEIALKGRLLNGWQVKTMKQASLLQADHVFKHLKFQTFGNKKFFKDIIKAAEDKPTKEELKAYISEFERGFFFRVNSDEDGGGVRVMKKIVRELGLNPANYFHKHGFQDHFFKLIKGKCFL